VREDSFFANAGVREGDHIVSIDGQAVTNENEFRRLMQGRQGRATLVVMRNGQRQRLTLNFDDMHAQTNPAKNGQTQQSKSALGIWFHCYPQGAQVMHVVPGSPAEKAGLRRGDWITSMNGSRWNRWEIVAGEIGGAEPETKAKLQVSRNGEMMDLDVRLADYQEIFADSPSWREIAAQYQYDDQQYLTGQPGSEPFDRRQESRGDPQPMEQRIRQLEQENADLRRRLQGGSPNGARTERQDNGQRVNAPPPAPNGQ
jgi:C-terminal processing protease CtpA/Prc